MSEDLFTKAMAKAYELHPCAQASSNFCWLLFKAGSETKDAEIKRLRTERESDCEIMRKTVSALTKACKDKDKLITELADALHEANNTLLFFYGATRALSVDALIQQAREANKDE